MFDDYEPAELAELAEMFDQLERDGELYESGYFD